MYQTYFGFAAAPFTIAPDPRYLYMSRRHQEALATLLYGLHGEGGFVLLTGEVGAGKTTLCRCLLEQIPDTCDVAYLFNPKLTVNELLSTICDEFGITYPPGMQSIKRFIDLINRYLLESHAKGRRAVLIIDEAQNLSPAVLEQIRLLTNLETNDCKLLQIVLLGQPELVDMLERVELRQLAQRIVARFHLTPLDRPEAAAYIRHRLAVAGAHSPLFGSGILRKVHKLSGGVPRVINVLCDRALLGAFVQHKERVDRATLRQAAREVLPSVPRDGLQSWGGVLLSGALVAGALAIAAATTTEVTRDERAPLEAPVAMMQAAPAPVAQVDAPPPARQVTRRTARQAATQTERRAPKVPAAVTAQEAPPVLVLPTDVPTEQSKQLAFATLLHKWRATYHDGENPCLQAAAQGMQCRTLRGELGDLRKLNAPVVLHMRDTQGQPFYAVLTELGPDSAALSFGAQIRNVSLDAMTKLWDGEYTMLQRTAQTATPQAQDAQMPANFNRAASPSAPVAAAPQRAPSAADHGN